MLTNRKIFLTTPPPLTASTTYTDETACTRQPRLRPGCHLHAVSSSYVIVVHCIGMDGPLTSWLRTPSDPCIIRVCSVVVVAPAAAHVSPRLACVDPVIVVWFLMGCMLHLYICLYICFRSKGICLMISPGGRVTSSSRCHSLQCPRVGCWTARA